MITATRLNGTSLIINADLIETMEANPDSAIFLVSGKKIIVRESLGELVRRIIDYKKRCYPLLEEEKA